jgi:hypothetical protein
MLGGSVPCASGDSSPAYPVQVMVEERGCNAKLLVELTSAALLPKRCIVLSRTMMKNPR